MKIISAQESCIWGGCLWIIYFRVLPFIFWQFCYCSPELTNILLQFHLQGNNRFPMAVCLIFTAVSVYLGTTGGFMHIQMEDLTVVMWAHQTGVDTSFIQKEVSAAITLSQKCLHNQMVLTSSSSTEPVPNRGGMWKTWFGWAPVGTWNVRVNIAHWSSRCVLV